MFPQPIRPSVFPASSTPMKRFFSHLPDWVDWSACGISRASANNIAIACSAVVIELPNGVFMTTMPRADARAADDLEPRYGCIHYSRIDPGRASNGETVIVAYDRNQLVGRQSRLF